MYGTPQSDKQKEEQHRCEEFDQGVLERDVISTPPAATTKNQVTQDGDIVVKSNAVTTARAAGWRAHN